jgi:hypothetical protein
MLKRVMRQVDEYALSEETTKKQRMNSEGTTNEERMETILNIS